MSARIPPCTCWVSSLALYVPAALEEVDGEDSWYGEWQGSAAGTWAGNLRVSVSGCGNISE